MCLNELRKNNYKPESVVKGWRLVHLTGKPLKNKWRPLFRKTKPKPFMTWLKSSNTTIMTNEEKYRSGWHFFKTKRDALYCYSYGIPVKVKARNVVAVGLQKGMKCLVAKEIFVYPPKKKETSK